MAQLTSLLDLMAQVETTRRRITLLSQERPEGWKTEYATARLTLDAQLSQLLKVGGEWLAKRGDTEAGQQFRDLADRAKSKMAQHQARWPVIIIKPDAPGYRQSVAGVDSVFAELLSLVRTLSKN